MRRRFPECPFNPSEYDVRLSYTRAIQFRSCPFFGHREVADPDEDIEDIGFADVETYSGPAAERGKFVHDVFGHYAKHCRTVGKASDPEALQAIFAKAIEELFPSWEISESIAEIVASFGSDHEFPALKPKVKWGAEEPVWWLLSNDNVRVAVLSILDYFEVDGNTAQITDYKSGYRLMSRDKFEADVQLPLYADALLHKYPHLVHIDGTLDYPAINAKMQKRNGITNTEIDRAELLLLETGAMLKAGNARIAKGEKPWDVFQPRPGKPCQPFDGVICGKARTCPYIDKLAKDAIIHNDDEARAQFADVLFLDALRKTKWAAVAEYVGGMKGLECNGKLAKMVARDKKGYDTAAVIHYLTERGIPLESALGIDMKRIPDELLGDLVIAGVVKVSREYQVDIVNAEEKKK